MRRGARSTGFRSRTANVCLSMGLVSAVGAAVFGADVEADRPLPVSFRGVPWREAVAQVADAVGAAYTLERSLTPDALNQPVRLTAEYLTADEVLRWLARWVGAGVIRVGDEYVFGRPETWPSAWRVRANISCVSPPVDAASGRDQRARAAEDRLGDVEWSDQTPSAALAEVRSEYGIDIIVEPAILGREELLTMTHKQVRLGELLTEMARVWDAVWVYEDGAFVLGTDGWVARMVEGRSREEAAYRGRAATVVRRAGGAETGYRWWTAWVKLEGKERSWKKVLWPMMQLMGEAARWRLDPGVRPRAAEGDLEAEGKAGEVLEGLELLGYLRWQRVPAAGSSESVEVRLR